MIQFLVESNLFPEPLIGEYDHIEDKTRTKGNRGEGDLHISRSLSPWVVEPGHWTMRKCWKVRSRRNGELSRKLQAPIPTPQKKKLKMKAAPNRSDRPTEFSVSCIAGKSELL